MKASLLGVALTVGLVLFGCGSGDSGGSGGPGGSGGSGGAGASGGSGGAGGTGGAGGAGGAGGTGGAGGAGGAGGSGGAMMLSSQGTVENTCGPADGPALDFRIGTPSTCPIMPYAQAFVHYYVEPGSTGSFAPGQSWSSDAPNGGNTAFVEWGSENNQAPAKSGSVEIISVAGNKVVVRYTFVTAAGEAYAGEADIVVCPSMPMCG